MSETLTPMMAQFKELKDKHPDAILLFRCGDFYETYMQDAILASEILGITLTHRSNKGSGEGTEMAGFPYHALDTYLPKLIRAGHRVAICDQLEDPKLTKKLVKRGITELVTPGVALSDNVLNSRENNFLAAIYIGKTNCGMSILDISTGEFAVAEGTVDYIKKLFTNFQPKEVLIERGTKASFEKNIGHDFFTFELDDWAFNEKSSINKLCKHFEVKNMKGYGINHMTSALISAGAILFYLDETKHSHLKHITTISRIDEERYVRLDAFTMRNLEILNSMTDKGISLLQVIDHTHTPMGARMLRRWLAFPLCDANEINKRHNCVDFFFKENTFRDIVRDNLSAIGDMERLVAHLASGRINPREMLQLHYSLEAVKPIKDSCIEASLPAIREIGEKMDNLDNLSQLISHTICPEPPIATNKGHYINDGVNSELDELRTISSSSKEYLLQMQQREIESTGISSLKIGFNNVFGYYLEVRNTFKDKVPSEWIRKQTLVNAERYITQELKEYEEKIFGAEDRMLAIEQQIYNDLILEASKYICQIQHNASSLATLDCLLSYAIIASTNKYVRPIVDDSTTLDIRQGRHPVIEAQLPTDEEYIPNDIQLDTEHQQIIVITGPNMSGKSALLRQTALITLLAQAGCFVPAEQAHIGVVDKIFTRVGASDNISMGESTFMVEMNEAANIMNNFTNRSLVIFDELGRGTSTYDGISIAWSIVEHLHNNPKGHPRTLFATHYHELNEMQKSLTRVHNFNVSVKEVDNHIVFMRKLVPGGSEHSFGIHVAKMAGMPPIIVKRADQVLKELEKNNDGHISRPNTDSIGTSDSGVQLSLFQLEDPVLCQIRDRILDLDINALTPLDALNLLNDIKKIVKS